ncbi:MAG TPA: hypothetical protein VNN81_16870 [Bradyrhizobium sp.]|nr:hypothetical protein [Bradyrhizobium sp.]
MGLSAADWIANGGVNRQVEIRAVGIERIGTANSQFIASLPPAMFAHDNAWIEFFAETRPDSHSAGRGAHLNPIAVLDSACCGSRRIKLDLRVQCALAQTRQCTMLGLTKKTGLGAGQDQREGSRQVRARNRTDWRFDKVRQGRITVIEEGLGPEFDFPRRRREAARVSFVVFPSVLGVTGRQLFPQSGRFGSKLIQGKVARAKLKSVSRIDITVPEMLAKAETHSEAEDEIGVRPCLARRGDDRLPKLNMRLCIFVDLKSDL